MPRPLATAENIKFLLLDEFSLKWLFNWKNNDYRESHGDKGYPEGNPTYHMKSRRKKNPSIIKQAPENILKFLNN